MNYKKKNKHRSSPKDDIPKHKCPTHIHNAVVDYNIN